MLPHRPHQQALQDRSTVRQMADCITSGQLSQTRNKSRRRSTSDSMPQSDEGTSRPRAATIERSAAKDRIWRNVPSHGHDTTPTSIHITPSVAAAYDKMRGRSRDNPGPLWQRIFRFPIPAYKHGTPRSKEWRPFSPNLPSLDPLDPQEQDTNTVPDGIALIYHHGSAPSKPLRPLDLSFTAAAARDFAREYDNALVARSTEGHEATVVAEQSLSKGDQAHEKYGYLSVNGAWVDPDSEEQVLDAINKTCSATAPHLPTSTRRGPRILSKAEEEREFDLLEEYVTDDEGDPRDARRNDISPYLFLCWACDVGVGPRFIKVEETAQHTQRFARRMDQRPKTPPRVYPQFDEETGSQLSGVYDIEHSPVPLWSPQGVEILNRPATFSRNNPQAHLGIERTAYGKPETTPHYLSQEYAEDLEMDNCITDTTGVRAFTNDGNYFHGQLRLIEYHAEMGVLYAARNLALSKYASKMEELDSLRSRRIRLEKQNFFLRKRIRERDNNELRRASEKAAKEEQRYRELLQERRERVSLDTEWASSMTERIHAKTMRLRSEMQEQEQQQANLLTQLGVDTLREVDDLYPKVPSSDEG